MADLTPEMRELIEAERKKLQGAVRYVKRLREAEERERKIREEAEADELPDGWG